MFQIVASSGEVQCSNTHASTSFCKLSTHSCLAANLAPIG